MAIDTSAVVAVIAHEPERDAVLDAISGMVLAAPESLEWEVGNAISAMFKRNRIDLAQAQAFIRDYEQMVFDLVDIDLDQAIELAYRLNLYAYDAYMIACALNLRLPLLALDRRLIAAARSVGVEALEVSS